MLKWMSGAVLLLSMAAAAMAGQIEIPNYDTARDDFFWPKLYSTGGFTLYCGAWFANAPRLDGRFPARAGLNVEHVYPASWMLKTAGCPTENRKQCRAISEAFNFMEADLHNLYPAISFINGARSNHPFDMIDGEDHMFDSCDFERVNDLVEPRPQARGNIARAYFYMHKTYDLPVPDAMKPLLLQWHKDDPVSEAERRRNKKIDELQGTRNAFIDDPALADTLGF